MNHRLTYNSDFLSVQPVEGGMIWLLNKIQKHSD